MQALHFLRKLAIENFDALFIHCAHVAVLPNLIEVVSDLPNVQLLALEAFSDPRQPYWEMAPRELLKSVNTWKNFDGSWETHPDRNDYVRHSLGHWLKIATLLGLETPLKTAADLVFDYPALLHGKAAPFDVLVINGAPRSGQLICWTAEDMDRMVASLTKRSKVITTSFTPHAQCTADTAMTVSQIGSLSRYCKYVIGVANGPMWPTWNIYNRESVEWRLVMVDHERIALAPNTEHVDNFHDARRMLELRGLL